MHMYNWLVKITTEEFSWYAVARLEQKDQFNIRIHCPFNQLNILYRFSFLSVMEAQNTLAIDATEEIVVSTVVELTNNEDVEGAQTADESSSPAQTEFKR